MEKLLDQEYIQAFLASHRLAILSTVNKEGFPDAAPVFFFADSNFDFFFVTPVGTQKNINLLFQNEAVLTITDEEKRETVSVRGKTSEQKDELTRILAQLAKKLNGEEHVLLTLPLLKYPHQEKTVIRVKPDQVTMKRYTNSDMEEKSITFTTSKGPKHE